MNADKYNAAQYASGNLTDTMITKLVEAWQSQTTDLKVDGYGGPETLASLAREIGSGIASAAHPVMKYFPLRLLPDGRRPVITSGFHTDNPSRSTHQGVDFFYPWQSGDPLVATGDGGAVVKRGVRKWWYPDGTYAVAAADGVVQQAGNTKTGWRVWVDHGQGERTGYFHMHNITVAIGSRVAAGDKLGFVGDNPSGHDAKHLHFEVSPADRYEPMNPRPWLNGALYLDA